MTAPGYIELQTAHGRPMCAWVSRGAVTERLSWNGWHRAVLTRGGLGASQSPGGALSPLARLVLLPADASVWWAGVSSGGNDDETCAT